MVIRRAERIIYMRKSTSAVFSDTRSSLYENKMSDLVLKIDLLFLS